VAYKEKRHTQKVPQKMEYQMDSQLKNILEKAPYFDDAFYSLRCDSVSNYINDLEYKLYWFKVDDMVAEAKDSYEIAKRCSAKESTIIALKKDHDDIKREYKELKNHLKYVKQKRK
jgi:predicted RNase H-like nuclease (RuvC/YqgF family)